MVLEINMKKQEFVFDNLLSEEVYNLTYKYGAETLEDRMRNVAMAIANVEKDKEYWAEQFLHILENFKFIPGGRIISNAGTPYGGTTLINCFVDGIIPPDADSMDGILEALRRQALILKSEGGYGVCADVLRPRGEYIAGIGNETPGVVTMLELWDKQSTVITSGSGKKSNNKNAKGKIRKGACLASLSIWHPDIEEFITAKQTAGRLTKFNLSVLISDDFINAVKNHTKWNLEFPDMHARIEDYPNLMQNIEYVGCTIKDIYKKYWDGNINKWKEMGLPTKIYKEYDDANILWDLITTSTYNRNEPGVLFVDTINRLNNLYYSEYISATNPCGEVPLPIGGSCLLGSLNLTQFINESYTDWDYDKLSKVIPIAIRFLDNVNDITNLPLQIQKEMLFKKRRIGFGITGYGSALIMLQKKYGSKDALELTNKLMEFLSNESYKASAYLAREKGKFPEFSEKYLEGERIKLLHPDTLELIKEYGIRNSHIHMIAPTGNTSVLANCISGGVEPIFMQEYIRTSSLPIPPDGLNLPININWESKKCDMNGHIWDWISEGDEILLFTKYNGIVYKIDKNRGLLKETPIVDYGVKRLKELGKWDDKAEWAHGSDKLSVDDHILTLEVFAKYVCSSISKTINLPQSYSYDDFKNVYLKAHETGVIKGLTTYRAGTMATVLSEKTATKKVDDNKCEDKRNGHIIYSHAPHRPKSVTCDVHHLTVNGQKWTVFIGLVSDENEILKPYEVFALKKKSISLPSKITKGLLTKIKRGKYNFTTQDGLELEDISSLFESNEQQSVTRLISLGLRHGANIKFIVEQLSKASAGFGDFSKAIVRVLKSYIDDNENVSGDGKCPNCKRENALVYQEGCVRCRYCEMTVC